jgi:long-subunit fatty acid transport protein
MFSVYGGARYIPATNTYTGAISNISVKSNGNYEIASTYLTSKVVPQLSGLAAQSTGAAASVQPLIAAGASALTLAQVQGAGYISAAQRAQLEGGLLNMGIPQASINAMPISTIQSTYTAGAANLNGQAATLTATAASLTNKAVDVKQTGTGITPIIGVNISPIEGLNIGMKYEFKTTLKLTNATKVDGTGMFPDKAETHSDIPALFSVGADYKFTKNLNMSVSYNNYGDKNVDWGKNIYGEPRTISRNSWEMAFGGQYQVVKSVALSMGYLHTEIGATEQFNSDFSYYSISNTYGGGFEIKPLANLTIDLGMLVTEYKNAPKLFKDADATIGNYFEVYKKHNLGFAIGLGYHFGGK